MEQIYIFKAIKEYPNTLRKYGILADCFQQANKILSDLIKSEIDYIKMEEPDNNNGMDHYAYNNWKLDQVLPLNIGLIFSKRSCPHKEEI